MSSRPKNLWHLLHCINPLRWQKFFNYGVKYCGGFKNAWGWDFSGSSNLPELAAEIRKYASYYRRTKQEVLKDLPAKQISLIPMDVDVSTLLEELQTAIEEKSGLSWEEISEYNFEDFIRHVPFELISRVRVEIGRLKASKAVEYLTDLLNDSDGKLVVFAHHVNVIEQIAEGLRDYGVVSLLGYTSPKARQEAVDAFQQDPGVRVFCGSLTAAGVGLNLTASSHAVLVEQSWVPSDNAQAIDRLHRIGQSQNVLAEMLYIPGCLDERILGICESKMTVIKAVI